MRFGLRRIFLWMALAAMLLTVYRRWPIDGVESNLLSLICYEDTVWAQSYSEEAFRAARIGMSREEIHHLLGPPIKTQSTSGEVRDSWTWSPDDGHYWRREVVFRGDIAVDKIAEFYVD